MNRSIARFAALDLESYLSIMSMENGSGLLVNRQTLAAEQPALYAVPPKKRAKPGTEGVKK